MPTTHRFPNLPNVHCSGGAMGSELVSFACGVEDDEAAIRAAIVEPWSNGHTEGQVTRLKLVKRQMYKRAHVGLLRARMVQPG